MRALCVVFLSVWVIWCNAASGAEATTAKGVVFEDANGNGVRDDGEAGIAGVRVSNGREIVLTGEDGAYALPVSDDTILFVIKPRGWMTPVDGLNLPRFYSIHKPAGSPKLEYAGVEPTGPLPVSVDFPLVKHDEPDAFSIIVFGDTQTRSLDDVNYLEHDVIEEVIGHQNTVSAPAVFGISLGDLLYDRLEIAAALDGAVAQIGVPFYNVLGNHDTNQDVKDDELSDETWERLYGPAYYSFDYGPVHFIHLDSVMWHWNQEEDRGDYHGGLGERQLEFVKNDLALVPKDQLVVLSMHIPILELDERGELYALMAGHLHCISFSGHTHTQQHVFVSTDNGWPGATPHHHVNVGAACGYWWHGDKDELGIPHATMGDGTPNGWMLVTFDGTAYSIRFKAARRPADHQMNIHTPEEVSVADAPTTDVLANVFAGSERSAVQMRVGKGAWSKMTMVTTGDPYMKALGYGGNHCNHMWQANLPTGLTPGTHTIEVTTTDMFGQTYTGRRIIRVVEGESTKAE
ncbi:MAG: calcineurin-like phosphoesterase C-terminal domain-containing protein [Verrucomicrobia bacterium]|nr:calcineurin-like phosphoesterase C-terminal domain-containing protein [Verrucomicrobiota bacterium]